jgi:hypothetical protein
LCHFSRNYPKLSKIPPDPDYADQLKVVIYTPVVDDRCGGVSVLHNLALTINQSNNESIRCLIYHYNHERYPNSFCNDFFNPYHIDDNTVVIYPEVIYGNPLGAKHVIRWILLDLGIDTPHHVIHTWNDKDLVYHWEPSKIIGSKQLVNIWLNPDIALKNLNSRTNTCYGLKKLYDCPRTLHHTPITKLHKDIDICIDHKETKQVIEIFNQSMRLWHLYAAA